MPGLFQKVINGIFPPIPKIYSEQLSLLIKQMLQVDPSKRPNVC